MDMPETPTAAKPAVTRNDVARLANVSSAVVSYVVNGGPKRVAPATAARVHSAIAALGYRPNAAARALKLGSSEMLGMIVPDATNPFFAALCQAVEIAAADRGYTVLIANSAGTLNGERRHLGNFASRRLDGVFLSSVLFEPDVRDLKAAEVPVVLLDHSVETPGFSSVGVDLADGAGQAVKHLISHGHTKIGLIMGTNTGGDLDAREVGWRQGLEEAGLQAGPVLRAPFSREGGYQAGKWLLNSTEMPTAVFASSDLLAVGMLLALHQAGIRVPQDLAIVSFDGSPEAEFSWPPLTTIAQPVEDMAVAAVEALVGDGAHLRNSVFPSRLITRSSCGCPPLLQQ